MPNAEYMREYRKTGAGKAAIAKQRKRVKARNRAMVALAASHPKEFEALFKEALKAEGIFDT